MTNNPYIPYQVFRIEAHIHLGHLHIVFCCRLIILTIIISGLWDSGQSGASLSSNAFTATLPIFGRYVVSLGLSIFAFTTLIGWSYYGDRNIEYLIGEKAVIYYRILFVMLIPLGAILKLKIVWNFSDIANALMAIPNLIGVVALSGLVTKMTADYFMRKDDLK